MVAPRNAVQSTHTNRATDDRHKDHMPTRPIPKHSFGATSSKIPGGLGVFAPPASAARATGSPHTHAVHNCTAAATKPWHHTMPHDTCILITLPHQACTVHIHVANTTLTCAKCAGKGTHVGSANNNHKQPQETTLCHQATLPGPFTTMHATTFYMLAHVCEADEQAVHLYVCQHQQPPKHCT